MTHASSGSLFANRAGYSMFSRIVSSAIIPSCCGSTATSSHVGTSCAGSFPTTESRPLSARSQPAAMLTSVVFPDPERPTSASSSPSRTSKEASRSACTSSEPRRYALPARELLRTVLQPMGDREELGNLLGLREPSRRGSRCHRKVFADAQVQQEVVGRTLEDESDTSPAESSQGTPRGQVHADVAHEE